MVILSILPMAPLATPGISGRLALCTTISISGQPWSLIPIGSIDELASLIYIAECIHDAAFSLVGRQFPPD